MPRNNILLRKLPTPKRVQLPNEYFMQNMQGSDAQIYYRILGLEGSTLEKSVREDKENSVKVKWEMVYQVKQSYKQHTT